MAKRNSRKGRDMSPLKFTLVLGSATATLVGANLMAGADWVEAVTTAPSVQPSVPNVTFEAIPTIVTRGELAPSADLLARGQAATQSTFVEIPSAYAPSIRTAAALPVGQPATDQPVVVQAPAGQPAAVQAPAQTQVNVQVDPLPSLNLNLAPLPSVSVPSIAPSTASAATGGGGAAISLDLPPIPQVVVPDPSTWTQSS